MTIKALNYFINTSDPTLELLSKMDTVFYLGGSRLKHIQARNEAPTDDLCMINIGPDTDYDLYATYTPALSSDLQRLGFQPFPSNRDPQYRDSEAVEIWYWGNVQIVLRIDAEFYREIFEDIDVKFFHDYIWKSSPTPKLDTQVLDIMRALLRAGRAATNK